MNKTKAELEAELAELRLEVAGLRASVEAYQFVFSHMPTSYYTTPTWDGTFYQFPTVTVTS